MKKLSGAQIIIESLIAEGVDVIFGYPGGAILPTYDALLDSKIQHVLVRHEQGAAHMAEGYARVSGRPGVVMVTSGPGATNTVTGIADANMDSTPMVVISGQVPTTMIGNDAFQEADFVGITRPCTKHNYLIKDVRDIARIIKEAFYIASTGRPGPVVIDVPKDVQQAEHVFKYPERVELRGFKPALQGQPAQDRPRHRGDQKKRQATVLRRRRRAMVGCGARTHSACARDGHPGDRDPDGPGLGASLRRSL